MSCQKYNCLQGQILEPPQHKRQSSCKTAKISAFSRAGMQSLEQSHASEFSFSKALAMEESGKLSLREDLIHLEKEDLVEIVMEQIAENKIAKLKLASLQEQLKLINTFREQWSSNQVKCENSFDDSEGNEAAKYRELAEYMEEYINNTNQAQNHFIRIISDLKTQNSLLKSDKRSRASYPSLSNQPSCSSISQYQNEHEQCCLSLLQKQKNYKNMEKQYEQIIKILEESLTHYMNINNEQERKYDKLKKAHEHAEAELAKWKLCAKQHQQMSMIERGNDRSRMKENQSILELMKQSEDQLTISQADLNCLHKYRQASISNKTGKAQQCNFDINKSANELVQLKQKIKILQIQNRELKQTSFSMQKMLESKSDKIRKLLEKMEKLSEQKWEYKQKYMEIKSKSTYKNRSSTKSSKFQTPSMSQDSLVEDFMPESEKGENIICED